MITQISPYMSVIATAILAIATFSVSVAYRKISPKLHAFLVAHVGAQNATILESVGKEAYLFAESAFMGTGGANKLFQATRYATDKLSRYGINVSADEVRTIIERAWFDAEGYLKTQMNAPAPEVVAAPVAIPVVVPASGPAFVPQVSEPSAGPVASSGTGTVSQSAELPQNGTTANPVDSVQSGQ